MRWLGRPFLPLTLEKGDGVTQVLQDFRWNFLSLDLTRHNGIRHDEVELGVIVYCLYSSRAAPL
jgi:hypothetical protein